MVVDTCTPDPCQDMTDDQIRDACAAIVTSAIDTIVEHMLMDQGPDEHDPHRIVDRFVTELRRVRRTMELKKEEWVHAA